MSFENNFTKKDGGNRNFLITGDLKDSDGKTIKKNGVWEVEAQNIQHAGEIVVEQEKVPNGHILGEGINPDDPKYKLESIPLENDDQTFKGSGI